MRSPETRNLAGLGEARNKTGFIGGLPNTGENTLEALDLQTIKLRRRFAMSWPLARITAEHAFGRPAA